MSSHTELLYPGGRYFEETNSVAPGWMEKNSQEAWSIENPLGELFTQDQLRILGIAVGGLSGQDFTLSENERRQGDGPRWGLTNQHVAEVRDAILKGPTGVLPEKGLYVLSVALGYLSLPSFGTYHPVRISDKETLMAINQLHGRVYQLAGFHNKAVNAMAAGK